MRAPLLGWEAFEEDETLSIDEVLTQGGEDFAEVGKGEVALWLSKTYLVSQMFMLIECF